MAKDPGEYNKRVSVEYPDNIINAVGDSVPRDPSAPFKEHSKRWASIEPLSAKELFQAQQIDANVSHRVEMPWFRELHPSWQIKYQGRTLHIVSPINVGERNEEWQLICSEEV